MKIGELIKRTGVSKQTIHYYMQSGLLPKARKLGPNVSDYHQGHVDRIKLIKDLQENYFLPLSVIRKLLKKYRQDPGSRTLLRVRAEYFRPLDRLLAGPIAGEEAFLAATGLRPRRLEQYETWGLITPEMKGGQKVYSYHDLIIARAIVQWREIGLTEERGFEPDVLKGLVESFRRIVAEGLTSIHETASKNLTEDEFRKIKELATEVSAQFCYHLYHKLAAEEEERFLKAGSAEAGPGGKSKE